MLKTYSGADGVIQARKYITVANKAEIIINKTNIFSCRLHTFKNYAILYQINNGNKYIINKMSYVKISTSEYRTILDSWLKESTEQTKNKLKYNSIW